MDTTFSKVNKHNVYSYSLQLTAFSHCSKLGITKN